MFGDRSILEEARRPDVIRRHPRAPWLAVGVVCFGAFMGQLDASIVTLTFRPMEHDFHAPLAAVQWVSLAYLLCMVALLAPSGRIADAVGRKLIYSYGFVVFTVASAACGLAPSLTALVLFRLVQAAGAAMLQSNSVALVTTSVPRAQMRLALSVQAAAQSLGLAFGPTLGGILTTTIGWRSVYWVNVPVGIVAVVAARYLLPRTREFSRTDSFDWAGALLLAVSTSGLLLALSGVSGLHMPDWAVAALFAGAVAAGIVFWVQELRVRFPLIPIVLLRSRVLALGLSGAFFGYFALFGPLVLIPQVLPGAHGGALRAGLLLSSLPVGFGVAALLGEAVLPRRMTNRARGLAGGLACGAALAALIALPMSTAAVVGTLATAGLGLGVFVPANNAVVMRSGQTRSASVLGGLINIARGIGTTFGIAVVTLALHLAGSTPERPHGGLALAVLAAAGVAAALIALAIRQPDTDDGRPGAAEGGPTGAFS